MANPPRVIYPSRMPSARKAGRHEIRDSLQSRILKGEWRPGDKLRQQQLAKDFGVSMGVVREALLELQAWGLVETRDNHGIYVQQWNVKGLVEAYEVREVLEGLAARRCCGRITRDQLRELEALTERNYQLMARNCQEQAANLDREFHRRLIEIADNAMVRRLTDSYRFIGKFVWFGGEAKVTRKHHLSILRALRENKPDEAERLGREHVAIGRRSIEQRIAAGSFEPHWIA